MEDSPLDDGVARRLRSAKWKYSGRLDNGTDLYLHTTPLSDTFDLDATIRHRPDSPDGLPFSYSVTRRQSGVNDDGSTDPGSEQDTNPFGEEPELVSKFPYVDPLLARHRDVVRHATFGARFSSDRAFCLMERADNDLRP